MCDFCKGEENICVEHKNGTTRFIEIRGRTLVADFYSEYVEVEINYCPMCGERLEQWTKS